LLDHRGGLEAYHRDDKLKLGVAAHFERNVRRMAMRCREAEVPLMLLSPPVNLRSCPPFKSEHRQGMTAGESDLWRIQVGRARRLSLGSPREAVRSLRRAIELDGEHAATHFALGILLESLGRRKEARRSFVRAKESDVCPLRMLESERASLGRAARRFGLPLLDLQGLLERHSDFESLGSDLLVEHVHATVQGQRLIAEAIVEAMSAEGWVEDVE